MFWIIDVTTEIKKNVCNVLNKKIQGRREEKVERIKIKIRKSKSEKM